MGSDMTSVHVGERSRTRKEKKSKEDKKEERRLLMEAKVAQASSEYNKLKKSLSAGSKENTCVDMYSVLLNDVLTLIPQTKAELEDDTGNTQMGYLFIALVGTARDLASEIRAVSDLEENIVKIMEDIIIPSATRQMQALLTEIEVMHEDLREIVPQSKRGPIREKVNKMLERYASCASDNAHKLIDDIREQLSN